MKEIHLTQGKVALVDDEDYEYLNQWKWNAAKRKHTFYAVRMEGGRKNLKSVMMHRSIMKPEERMIVDHIDHNGLNNQRLNLRVCSSRQNSHNITSQKNSSSKFLGVNKKGLKFQAVIRMDGKYKYIGIFINEIDAAKAYDAAAKEHHGEFANLNFK